MQLKATPDTFSKEAFLSRYGLVYEHSPWVAEQVWQQGGADRVDTLHAAMKQVVEAADYKKKLALVRAHPDLACAQGELTDASQSEQKGAGLKECSAEEFAEFQKLNVEYREKFGFPFIIAVKGLTRQDILKAFRARIRNTPDEEFNTAMAQIHKIARFRLEAMAEEEAGK